MRCYGCDKLFENHSDLSITVIISFSFAHGLYNIICYLVREVILFLRIKFSIFMLSKHSLGGNLIGVRGGVALGQALKVNKTLQTLK